MNRDEQAALELLSIHNGQECDIYETDEENKSNALMWACYYKLEEVAIKILDVYLLVDVDEYMGYTNTYNKTALQYACAMNVSSVPIKMIDMFAEYCNPSQVNINGETALAIACSNASKEVILKLIDQFGVLCRPEQVTKDGRTAFLLSCSNNKSIEVITTMIDRFGLLCRPEQITNNKHTVLMYVCTDVKLASVAIKMIDRFGALCKPGQVITTTSGMQMNAFSFACNNNMSDVAIKMLRIFGASVIICPMDIVFDICSHKQYKLLLELLAVCPELIRENGGPLLHRLITGGYTDQTFKYNNTSQKCVLTLFNNNILYMTSQNVDIIKQCIKDALRDKAEVDSKISLLCSVVNVPRTNKRLRGFQTVMSIDYLEYIIREFCYNSVGPFHAT